MVTARIYEQSAGAIVDQVRSISAITRSRWRFVWQNQILERRAMQHYNDWPNAGAFNALKPQTQKTKLEVSGYFPNYVAGTLHRAGPGGYRIPRAECLDGDFACDHWFDGFSYVYRFELVPGKDVCSEVHYSSRCLVDGVVDTAARTGRLEGLTFGQKRDLHDTFDKKMQPPPEMTSASDAKNVNLGVTIREPMLCEMPDIKGQRKVLVLTTDARIRKASTTVSDELTFDADTLEPLGVTRQVKMHPDLKGQLSGAHACHDHKTGEWFNYNLELGPKTIYRVFRANPNTSKVDILAEISDRELRPAYIHSMLLTENFVILCVFSSILKNGGMDMLWTRNIMDSLAPIDSSSKVTWLVVDRHGGGLVKKFTSPAFFSFNTTNAWEEANKDGTVDIVCELFEFKTHDILHRFYYKNLVSNESNTAAFNKAFNKNSRISKTSQLARYKLPDVHLPGSQSVNMSFQAAPSGEATRVLSMPGSETGDLQMCNPNFLLRKHRYVWAAQDSGKSSFMDALVKTDTQTQASVTWSVDKHTPTKPFFVPAPHAQAEDEGAVLSIVYNGVTDTSYLLCLDAATMQELGRAEVGAPVGIGFDGKHTPAAR
ncbi:uncharacterized protein MYCFIDRAFT_142919 [Pseudocercospora fijiensis CIRAD86]|uniref:Uncharacterized protein n=1 Tax=Pseudocercospora fijiensis (strain CIRAD86) TaxID=383855 RepID=M3AQX6_PSEFD|nr:uncharacterized protein MYCFIDRAFT_142919 [Pseudocercospora fijiensis CIRAD86]EME79817.1 hypothetical protein MYCFIDRAFT_142919 [Pseudocercospora fijiensis CIRAD86]